MQGSRPLVLFAAALAFSLAPAPAAAQRAKKDAPAPVYYPGYQDDWERRAPEAVGMDPALVKEAIELAVANESKAPRDLSLAHPLAQYREPYDDPVGPLTVRGPQSGVILRHGYLVAEWGEPKR